MLIGLDIGGTKIEGAAFDDHGATLARERIATPRGDYAGSLDAIAALVLALERRFGAADGVGAGVPGSISPATGLVRNANSTWLNGRPFKSDLEARLGRKLRIENDANCFAASEATDGAAAGARVVVAVILGTGCGAGVAIDGKPWSGRNGIAGEFGHNPLPWADGADEVPGPRCWCGRRGCVETYLSGPGFAARHAGASAPAEGPDAIIAAARLGDPPAARSLELYRDRLARTLGTVVNLIDPDAIVLGGGVSNAPEIYEGLDERIGAWTFADATDTPVLRAAHGDSSGVRGAAWLWRS